MFSEMFDEVLITHIPVYAAIIFSCVMGVIKLLSYLDKRGFFKKTKGGS